MKRMADLVGHNLTFRRGRRAVLERASVTVSGGRAGALLGPSGSGKTTLLWLLVGLLKPAGGSVLVRQGVGKPESVEHRRLRLGMVFQQEALWEHLSVDSHLRLVLSGKGLSRRERSRRVDRAAGAMKLSKLRRRLPGELSGGERRCLAIARALVVDPQFLLLDEPLAHLDGPTREELFVLLREAIDRTRAGVLMATHISSEALRICDDVTVLLEGKVVQSGAAEDVYRNPASLQSARVLGLASELSGSAAAGCLSDDGVRLLEGIDSSLAGPARLILRPEDLSFVPDVDGPAEVVRCELIPSGYLLTVRAGGATVHVHARTVMPPGARGRLRFVRGG